MKASLYLWRQWYAQVRQLLPDLHGHRTKSLAFFVFGLVLSGKARLPLVAEELLRISPAKTPSIEHRLQRFLSNDQITVVPIWTSLLAHLLPFFRGKRLTFVLDPTPLSDRACVVYLGLLVHSRLLPVGWQVMPLQQTWEERQWAIVGTLLDRVIPHVGTADCTLVADSGLSGLPLVQLCQARHWHYLLRLSSQHTCRPLCGKRAGRWWALSDLVSRMGQSWFGPALLWQEHHPDAFLSAVWSLGIKAPGFSSPTCRLGALACKRTGGVCASKPPFAISNGEAGTSRGRWSPTAPVWSGSCSCCFWVSGGSAIWQPLVCTTDTASDLTGMTGATRGFFGLDACGCTICCGGTSPPPRSLAVCRFTAPERPWPSPSASRKNCQGERIALPAQVVQSGLHVARVPHGQHIDEQAQTGGAVELASIIPVGQHAKLPIGNVTRQAVNGLSFIQHAPHPSPIGRVGQERQDINGFEQAPIFLQPAMDQVLTLQRLQFLDEQHGSDRAILERSGDPVHIIPAAHNQVSLNRRSAKERL
jgi:hypothetical protein